MKRKLRVVIGIWILGVGICLSGCAQVTLYNDLTQEDANKVLVLLQQQGVEATMVQEVRQNEVFWSIKISKEHLAKARELIVTSNIISPRSPGLKEVYQPKGGGGWIKTPAEERARFILALKGEIVNSLKKLPNVVDADVVLNLPEEQELGDTKQQRPTASIVIKAQMPGKGESALSEIEIQKFVSNAVDGMGPRDVAVLIHFVEPFGKRIRPGETVLLPTLDDKSGESGEIQPPVQLMGLKLDSVSREKLKIYLVIFFGVLLVLSGGLVVAIISGSRMRQEIKGLKGGAKPPALEGEVLRGRAAQLPPGEKEEE